MRHCLFLVALFLTTEVGFCQSVKTPLYSVENNLVIPKGEFVSQMKNTTYSDITPYTTVSNLSFKSLDALHDYKVTLYRYKGWEGEAGDFQSVCIKSNNKTILQLDNQDGWVTLPSTLCPTKGVNLYYEQLDSATTLLYLTGYTYNSNPGFLTLILLRNGVATPVFNKEYAASSIERRDGVFTIDLKDRFEEYTEGSATPTNKPVTCRISYEGGILFFRQN